MGVSPSTVKRSWCRWGRASRNEQDPRQWPHHPDDRTTRWLTTTYFDDDTIDVRLDNGGTRQFYWGDVCTRIPDQDSEGKWRVRAQRAGGRAAWEGYVRAGLPLRESGLLRLAMVDVQQGDGLILQTPDDKIIFIDGGDNKLFARFVAAAFPGQQRGETRCSGCPS